MSLLYIANHNALVQDTLLCPQVIYTLLQVLLGEGQNREKMKEGKPEVGVNAVRGIFASISAYLSINKVACLFSETTVIDS